MFQCRENDWRPDSCPNVTRVSVLCLLGYRFHSKFIINPLFMIKSMSN